MAARTSRQVLRDEMDFANPQFHSGSQLAPHTAQLFSFHYAADGAGDDLKSP